MIYTTLNEIRKHHPCKDGWEKLLAHLGKTKADDEPLSFGTILDSNGIDDALWCLRALDGMDGPIRELACDFAETAIKYVPEDEDRPRKAIETARRYARGEATDEELAAADAAARAARAAWAASDAAWAAWAASDAAWAARAAWAASDAARAAWAASDAAWAAARAAAGAARDAAVGSQKEIFIAWLDRHEEGVRG